jgi:hypothetical protein
MAKANYYTLEEVEAIDIKLSKEATIDEIKKYAKTIDVNEMAANNSYQKWLPARNNALIDELTKILESSIQGEEIFLKKHFAKAWEKAGRTTNCYLSVDEIEKKLNRLNNYIENPNELAIATKLRTLLSPSSQRKSIVSARDPDIALGDNLVAFFRDFYDEVNKLHKQSGKEYVSGTFTIHITTRDRQEYGRIFECVKNIRTAHGLNPLQNNDPLEKNVMDLERDNNCKKITVTFKDVKRSLLERDGSFAIEMNKQLREQQKTQAMNR